MTIVTPVAAHQTTKPYCRIHHLGLDEREADTIARLLSDDVEGQGRYVFGPPAGDDHVDLLLVNADNPIACSRFHALRAQRPELLAVMVSEEDRDFGAQRVLRRPVTARNLIAILESLTKVSVRDFGPLVSAGAVRVLVVDDSLPARQYLKLKLEQIALAAAIALHVDIVDSGDKALEVMTRHTYDLVFLDVVMPGMDGYEVCRRMKQIAPVRVAMLSGRAAPVDYSRGRTAGCDNYLPKPANDTDLRTVLRLTALKKQAAPMARAPSLEQGA